MSSRRKRERERERERERASERKRMKEGYNCDKEWGRIRGKEQEKDE